jgi:hypothetical protein
LTALEKNQTVASQLRLTLFQADLQQCPLKYERTSLCPTLSCKVCSHTKTQLRPLQPTALKHNELYKSPIIEFSILTCKIGAETFAHSFYNTKPVLHICKSMIQNIFIMSRLLWPCKAVIYPQA